MLIKFIVLFCTDLADNLWTNMAEFRQIRENLFRGKRSPAVSSHILYNTFRKQWAYKLIGKLRLVLHTSISYCIIIYKSQLGLIYKCTPCNTNVAGDRSGTCKVGAFLVCIFITSGLLNEDAIVSGDISVPFPVV